MLALAPNAQISTSTKSSWKHLDEKTVMDRLNELSNTPNGANLIDQGANSLCGEATFYHHIIQRAPEKFFTMGEALFRDGICRLGELKINPRPKLKNANYSTIKDEYVSTTPNFIPVPPQADWMLLTALRDSHNFWSHDYEGRPDQTKAEGSTFKERYRWYKQSGLYKNEEVQDLLNPLDLSASEEIELVNAITKTRSNHISMDINEAMIRTGFDGQHTISLESPLLYDPLTNSVTFTYWSWGGKHNWDEFLAPKPLFMTINHFVTNLDSVVIAPYDL
jgi:hypothetical protein